MRRLLVFSPGTDFFSGCERYAFRVITEARERGFHVTVVMPKTPRLALGWEHAAALGVEAVKWNEKDDANHILDAAAPDVVLLALPWPTTGYEFMCAAASRARTIAVFQLAAPASAPAGKPLPAGIIPVVVAEENIAHIKRIFGPEVEPHIVYNGVDVPESLKRSRSEPPTALTVGRLVASKGFHLLAQVASRLPSIRFRWAGAAAPGRVIASYGRFELLGERHDIPALMEDADFFVLPSYVEGSSFALLEAMAHGVVPIVSNGGGNPEIVEHGKTGFVFERGSPKALHEALEQASGSDLASLGEAATRSVLDRFTARRMLDQTFALF